MVLREWRYIPAVDMSDRAVNQLISQVAGVVEAFSISPTATGVTEEIVSHSRQEVAARFQAPLGAPGWVMTPISGLPGEGKDGMKAVVFRGSEGQAGSLFGRRGHA